MLQQIDPQHPLHPDRRSVITRLRADQLDQRAQRPPRTRSISVRNAARRIVFAYRSNPGLASVNCFAALRCGFYSEVYFFTSPNPCVPIHPARLYHDHGRWLLQSFLKRHSKMRPCPPGKRASRVKLILDLRAVTLELAVHPKVCLIVPNAAGEIGA